MIPGIPISPTIDPNKDKPNVLTCSTCVYWNKTLKACLHQTNVGINYELGTYIPKVTCQEKRVNPGDCGPSGKFHILAK